MGTEISPRWLQGSTEPAGISIMHGSQRAGDDERSRVSKHLTWAQSKGYIDGEEHQRRQEHCLQAVTLRQLDTLIADLKALPAKAGGQRHRLLSALETFAFLGDSFIPGALTGMTFGAIAGTFIPSHGQNSGLNVIVAIFGGMLVTLFAAITWHNIGLFLRRHRKERDKVANHG